MIIDNQIAFCGGQDLSLGKWDISDHEFDNPSRDLGSEPWHDIHTMVEGHTVWDLIYHFNQRWLYSIWKDIRQVKKIVKPSSICSYVFSTSPSSALLFDKCIEIMNSHGTRNKMIDIEIRNNCTGNKDTTDEFHNHKVSCSIKERDLHILH